KFSMSPAPKTGVGILKMMFRLRTWVSKSSCLMLQPGASLCPAITNRAWTPPSREPSGLNWKRASRIGPLAVMNDGKPLPTNPRSEVILATSGFTAGLVPPVAGWACQHPDPRFAHVFSAPYAKCTARMVDERRARGRKGGARTPWDFKIRKKRRYPEQRSPTDDAEFSPARRIPLCILACEKVRAILVP